MYFSVIIPLFNKKNTLKETIDSVLAQSHKEFELIIVNDGSNDGSECVVKAISDSRIKLINQKNQGVSVARNRGMAEAQYNYACFLDADDRWCKEYLKIMSELVTDYPEYKIFSLRHEIIQSDGSVISPGVGVEDGFYGELKDFVKLYTHNDGLVHSSSVCLEKKYFQKLGGFPKEWGNGEDIYLWLLYGINTDIIFKNTVCAYYYRDAQNSSIYRKVYQQLPYQLTYFYPYIKNHPVEYMRGYLQKSALLHIAGLKTCQEDILALKHSWKIFNYDKTTGLLSFLVAITPNIFIKIIKFFRNKLRLKNTTST